MKFTTERKYMKSNCIAQALAFSLSEQALAIVSIFVHVLFVFVHVLFLHCAIFITAVLEAENNWIPTESDRRL